MAELPPLDLVSRVGTVEGRDPLEFYLAEGARLRALIDELLPVDWEWHGKRALDFGCGAARVVRHFEPETAVAEFSGCDIDLDSIAWDQAHLSPPFRFFHSTPDPPLELESGSLDLIWAMSVFTHITDGWAAWLAELHRLLAPEGILIASFLGQPMWESLVGEPYQEDQLGMAVLHHWEGPGAWVFHSEWWLQEHWGRAFEILDIRQPARAADGSQPVTHSYITMRRTDRPLTAAELEHVEADRREIAALQTSLRLARRELAELDRTRGPQEPLTMRTLPRRARGWIRRRWR